MDPELEFEELNEDIIEGHQWAQDLRLALHSSTDKFLFNWCKVVLELGEKQVDLGKWVDIFRGQIEDRYKELVMDVIDMKAKIIDNITELLEKTQSYAKELGLEENLADINPDDRYYLVLKDLQQRTDRLESMVKQRKVEMDNLLEKQKALCSTLEKTPYIIKTSPLPPRQEIEKLQQYVENLEQEKFDREERFLNMKEAVVTMAKELEIVPKSDFERQLLSDSNKEFDITKSNLEHLEKYHRDMVNQLASMKEDIDHLRQTVGDLWNILEESMSERDSFHDRNPGYSVRTLNALRAEVKRCEDLKKANIKVFVERLRTELKSLWHTCYHKNTEELGTFSWFTSDFYTEDVLSYHEMEVTKFKNFYTKNEKLIKLFAEHEKLWNHLLDMENKDSDGLNRYKNRGGQLLKEEKERNKLAKKIPLLEEKIKVMATDYEDYHGSPFQIFGIPILEYIDNLHQQRDQYRKEKLSARKQIREQETITPAKSCLSLFPSTSRMHIPTPQSAIASKRKLVKPQTTGKKLKLQTVENAENLLSLSNERLHRSRRLSREKNRRIAKCRKMLKLMPKTSNKENVNITQTTDYDTFERNLPTTNENFRSTIIFNETTDPLQVIRAKTPNHAELIIPDIIITATPSRHVQPRTPKSNKTLTRTPSKLKLIF